MRELIGKTIEGVAITRNDVEDFERLEEITNDTLMPFLEKVRAIRLLRMGSKPGVGALYFKEGSEASRSFMRKVSEEVIKPDNEDFERALKETLDA